MKTRYGMIVWTAWWMVMGLGQGNAWAQDGRVVDSSRVRLSDGERAGLVERVPTAATLLDEVIVNRITYMSDGLRVKAYVARPRGSNGLPIIIANRGGNRDFGAWSDARAAVVLGRMASWGYVVLASQYRGVVGGDGVEEFGGAEIADVLNLLAVAATIAEADTSRIGMWGWSRGGMMTYLALTKTNRVRAAVIGAAPVDMRRLIALRPEMETNVLAELVPNYADQRAEALSARSAIDWPAELSEGTPLLLLHGTADWRVDVTESLRMGTALYETKRPFRLVVFEGGDHGLSEHSGEVNRLTRLWLETYVRDGASWPSLEPHGRE